MASTARGFLLLFPALPLARCAGLGGATSHPGRLVVVVSAVDVPAGLAAPVRPGIVSKVVPYQGGP